MAVSHPEVLTDPHWGALATQLDRIADAGGDVAALLAEVTAERALPAQHPARSLDYRLHDAMPQLPRPLPPGSLGDPTRGAAPDPSGHPPTPPYRPIGRAMSRLHTRCLSTGPCGYAAAGPEAPTPSLSAAQLSGSRHERTHHIRRRARRAGRHRA